MMARWVNAFGDRPGRASERPRRTGRSTRTQWSIVKTDVMILSPGGNDVAAPQDANAAAMEQVLAGVRREVGIILQQAQAERAYGTVSVEIEMQAGRASKVQVGSKRAVLIR